MGYNQDLPSWQASASSYPRSKQPYRRRMPQKSFFLVVSGILIFFFWITHRNSPPIGPPLDRAQNRPPTETEFSKLPGGDLPCRSLPGAEDVLMVLKTGSTELQDKLPIHLTTTLRCYPNYVIFSDYEEDYHGEHILDALDNVDPQLKKDHPDFELWRRLQSAGGRSALKPSERSGPISRPQGNTGKPSNPGWKLDKWKFLPMMNRTLVEYPEMKWYVFFETDTYILWQTLLNYLRALDWTKPYYVGGQIWIGDIVFAHGGTGFAVSRPALTQVVNMFRENQKEWEDFTNGHWAGDCVLGKAFKDSGAPLLYAWPIWQADDVGNMNYERVDNGHRLWCKPSVSYHHLSPSVVEEMWGFEQEWISKNLDVSLSFVSLPLFGPFFLARFLACDD